MMWMLVAQLKYIRYSGKLIGVTSMDRRLAIACGSIIALIVLTLATSLTIELLTSKHGKSPESILYTGKQLESNLTWLSEYSHVMECIEEHASTQNEMADILPDRISVMAQKGTIYCADEKVTLQQIIDGPERMSAKQQTTMIEPRSCTGILHELYQYCPKVSLSHIKPAE